MSHVLNNEENSQTDITKGIKYFQDQRFSRVLNWVTLNSTHATCYDPAQDTKLAELALNLEQIDFNIKVAKIIPPIDPQYDDPTQYIAYNPAVDPGLSTLAINLQKINNRIKNPGANMDVKSNKNNNSCGVAVDADTTPCSHDLCKILFALNSKINDAKSTGESKEARTSSEVRVDDHNPACSSAKGTEEPNQSQLTSGIDTKDSTYADSEATDINSSKLLELVQAVTKIHLYNIITAFDEGVTKRIASLTQSTSNNGSSTENQQIVPPTGLNLDLKQCAKLKQKIKSVLSRLEQINSTTNPNIVEVVAEESVCPPQPFIDAPSEIHEPNSNKPNLVDNVDDNNPGPVAQEPIPETTSDLESTSEELNCSNFDQHCAPLDLEAEQDGVEPEIDNIYFRSNIEKRVKQKRPTRFERTVRNYNLQDKGCSCCGFLHPFNPNEYNTIQYEQMRLNFLPISTEVQPEFAMHYLNQHLQFWEQVHDNKCGKSEMDMITPGISNENFVGSNSSETSTLDAVDENLLGVMGDEVQVSDGERENLQEVVASEQEAEITEELELPKLTPPPSPPPLKCKHVTSMPKWIENCPLCEKMLEQTGVVMPKFCKVNRNQLTCETVPKGYTKKGKRNCKIETTVNKVVIQKTNSNKNPEPITPTTSANADNNTKKRKNKNKKQSNVKNVDENNRMEQACSLPPTQLAEERIEDKGVQEARTSSVCPESWEELCEYVPNKYLIKSLKTRCQKKK